MAITNKLTAIADAIREKNGQTDTYTMDEMATAIKNLPKGVDIVGMKVKIDVLDVPFNIVHIKEDEE